MPVGDDIFEYLRGNLEQRNLWVFFMLSKNFYESPYCLNEMSAAWVRQSKSYNILLHNFSHNEIDGVVSNRQLTLDLCDPVRLTEIFELFRKTWKLQVDNVRWAAIQQDFVSKINKLYEQKAS